MESRITALWNGNIVDWIQERKIWRELQTDRCGFGQQQHWHYFKWCPNPITGTIVEIYTIRKKEVRLYKDNWLGKCAKYYRSGKNFERKQMWDGTENTSLYSRITNEAMARITHLKQFSETPFEMLQQIWYLRYMSYIQNNIHQSETRPYNT